MSRQVSLLVSLLLFASLSGCANTFRFSPSNAPGPSEPMSQSRMEAYFADEVDAIVGPPGAIQTRIDGISIYLLSDSAKDRMQLVAPITSSTNLNQRAFSVLLQANFNRTLDARYAVSDGVVYAVFQHPISSLSPELIKSALAQVESLAKTFGNGFSAGELPSAAQPTPDS